MGGGDEPPEGVPEVGHTKPEPKEEEREPVMNLDGHCVEVCVVYTSISCTQEDRDVE